MAQTSVAPSALTSKSVGLPSLVVVESTMTLEEAEACIKQDLAGFMKASDAVSVLDHLNKGMSVLYIERGEKLDPRVETIVTTYAAGIASFATQDGLISAQFDPMRAALAIVISRATLEKSYAQLLTYVGAATSIA
ncbi:MAG: hypothetical protein ABSB00_01525 [Minisyncoccia bacterium]|jgi:hypothetical protein